jgi:hypothetical protein
MLGDREAVTEAVLSECDRIGDELVASCSRHCERPSLSVDEHVRRALLTLAHDAAAEVDQDIYSYATQRLTDMLLDDDVIAIAREAVMERCERVEAEWARMNDRE